MTRLFWIVALVLATNLCSAAPPLPRDALHERRSLILSQRMLNKVLANAVSISNQRFVPFSHLVYSPVRWNSQLDGVSSNTILDQPISEALGVSRLFVFLEVRSFST